jgi:chromosome segregation ATPase
MLVIRSLFKPFICFYPDGAAGGGASGTEDPAPVGDGAPGTANQPDLKALQAEIATWQSRATGWQKSYQTELDAHKLTKTTLEQLQEANTKIVTEHTAIVEEHKALKEKETTLTADLGTKNTQLERLTMITTEFPELVPFLKDNLLPEGTGEELKGKLKVFSEKIMSMTNLSAEQIARQTAEGATPPPPPPENNPKKGDLKEQAIAALKNGNQADYDRLMNEYYASLKQ